MATTTTKWNTLAMLSCHIAALHHCTASHLRSRNSSQLHATWQLLQLMNASNAAHIAVRRHLWRVVYVATKEIRHLRNNNRTWPQLAIVCLFTTNQRLLLCGNFHLTVRCIVVIVALCGNCWFCLISLVQAWHFYCWPYWRTNTHTQTHTHIWYTLMCLALQR